MRPAHASTCCAPAKSPFFHIWPRLGAGSVGRRINAEQPLALRGTWYRLPAGTADDDAVFFLNNDYAGHWSWEPAQNLLLADYVAALAAINQDFIRV